MASQEDPTAGSSPDNKRSRKRPDPTPPPSNAEGKSPASGPLWNFDPNSSEAAAESAVPQLPGYQITGRLGEGGMGVVWAGIQLAAKRRVAVKLLSAANFGSKKARTRFAREVQLAANLEHPNIARVYDSGLTQGVCYYAMELIDGVALDQFVNDRRISLVDTLRLMLEICLAIQYAHQRGIMHRDLKPSNILVSQDGRSHILDFGLAKDLSHDDSVQITVQGAITGTPAYMAPEQATGHSDKIDARADVYSLGIILYELLTKKRPHNLEGSNVTVLRRIAEEEIIPPRHAMPGFNVELEAILLKALARLPQERYQTAEALSDDLRRFLDGAPVAAHPATITYFLKKRLRKHRMRVAVAAVIAVVLAAGATAAYVSLSAAGRRAAIAAEKERIAQEALKANQQDLQNAQTKSEQLARDAQTAADAEALAKKQLQENQDALARAGAAPPATAPQASPLEAVKLAQPPTAVPPAVPDSEAANSMPSFVNKLEWIHQFGTPQADRAHALALDRDGSVVVAGETLGSLSEKNAGGIDLFAREYAADGTLKWDKQYGTPVLDRATDIALDSSAIYMAGEKIAILGGQIHDAVLYKVDLSGKALWNSSLATGTDEHGAAVAADGAGSVYICGHVNGKLGAQHLGGVDAFLAKYDSSGKQLWINQFGTKDADAANAVVLDAKKNSYVAGSSVGSFTGATAGGAQDAILVKFDPAGKVVWKQQFGSPAADAATGLAINAAGTLYVVGSTWGVLGGQNFGGRDIFLAKYTSDGRQLWLRQIGTNLDDATHSPVVASDPAGGVCIGMTTAGVLVPGSFESGQTHGFVLHYNDAGEQTWTRQIASYGADDVSGLAIDARGAVCVTGTTTGALDGPKAGDSDVYVLKFLQDFDSVTFADPALAQAAPRAAKAFTPHGAVGVGTWNTEARFRNIKVSHGDQLLYQADLSKGLDGWTLGPGKWQVDNGSLHQNGYAEACTAIVGDPSWTDYTLTLEAEKLGGDEGFLVLFHAQDANHYLWLNVGGWSNTRTSVEKTTNAQKDTARSSSDMHVENNRWYDVRVEVRGAAILCYLDGKLVSQATDRPH